MAKKTDYTTMSLKELGQIDVTTGKKDIRTKQQKVRDEINAARGSWATQLKKKVHAELAPVKPAVKKQAPDTVRTTAIKGGLKEAGLTEKEIKHLQGK